MRKCMIPVFFCIISYSLCFGSEKPEIFVQMGHTEEVEAMDLSPDGRYALSAIHKTIYIWEVETGRLVNLFDKHKGSVRSIQFSPDGEKVLSLGQYIYLWDFHSREVIHLFKVEAFKKFYCAFFSPDGDKILAPNNEGDMAPKVWDVESGQELKPWKGYEDVMSIYYDPARKWLITKYNRQIKIMNCASRQVIHSFDEPFFILDVSQNDQLLRLDGLWDIDTWKQLHKLEFNRSQFRDFKGYSTGCFSADGNSIILCASVGFTTGRNAVVQNKGYIFVYDVNTLELTSAVPVRDCAISHIRPASDGRRVLVSGYGRMNTGLMLLVDLKTGQVVSRFDGASHKSRAISISSDSRLMATGGDDGFIHLWSLESGQKLNSKEMVHQFGIYMISDLAFSSDGSQIFWDALASNWGSWDLYENSEILKYKNNKLFEKNLKQNQKLFRYQSRVVNKRERNVKKGLKLQVWPQDVLRIKYTKTEKETLLKQWGGVSCAQFYPAGDKIITGSQSGATIKLWDAKSGQELVTFYVLPDGEWVSMTPEGYFNASENGSKYIHCRIGDKLYSIDQFFEQFYRPDIVAEVLEKGKQAPQIAEIPQADPDKLVTLDKPVRLPPEVRIVSPHVGDVFEKQEVDVTVEVRDMGGGIDEVRLFQNGKWVAGEERGIRVTPQSDVLIKTCRLLLLEGENRIRVLAFSSDRIESNADNITILLKGPERTTDLWLLTVGINAYQNSALNLNYAEPDAHAIHSYFETKAEKLFRSFHPLVCLNQQATRQGILSQFEMLESRSRPEDLVIVYLAGHGDALGEEWYFIPHDLVYPENGDQLRATGLSASEISDIMTRIRAQKILMLVDACKSGQVLVAFRGLTERKALLQLARSSGTYVVAATTSEQLATEFQELGHGVFTYTLLQGLKGEADGSPKDGRVTVEELSAYIKGTLPELTQKYRGQAQYPTSKGTGMDFPLMVE
ncbi:caspase family protein [bacterium]|nr:caspase family protein [bacterium]